MSGLEPVVIPAMMAATEAGGAGMAAAAAAEAAAAASAAGLGASAIPGIAATAAGSAVPGAALPAMAATGTQGGLAGAMGTYAPVVDAMAGQSGPVLAGMNQGANLLTTPFAKFIDTVGPMARKAGSAYQMGSKFGNALAGQQQGAQRPLQPPAPAPQINPMPQQMQRTPTPVELLAWRRAQQRKRMMGDQGGMMS